LLTVQTPDFQDAKMGDVFKMIKSKRGSAWIWILIILILLALGVGIWFWLSGGNLPAGIGGSSIPSPPALPN